MKPPKPKSTREPLSAKVHLAVCTAVIEIGTQEKPKFKCPGETEWKPQVILSFDFPGERYEMEVDGEMKSFPKNKTPFACTFSYHKKSKLGMLLQTWIGYLPDYDYDLFEVLGKPAMVTIGHSPGKEGAVYDDIVAVTQLIDGIAPPKAERDVLRYSLQEDGKNIPSCMPEWIVEKIHKAKEWSSIEKVAELAENQTNVAGTLADDDIPF